MDVASLWLVEQKKSDLPAAKRFVAATRPAGALPLEGAEPRRLYPATLLRRNLLSSLASLARAHPTNDEINPSELYFLKMWPFEVYFLRVRSFVHGCVVRGIGYWLGGLLVFS